MNDRLRDLQKGGGGDVSHEDIELGDVQAEQSNDFMNGFFQDVGLIKSTMANIRRNIKQIEEKYVQQLNSVSMDQGGSILHLLYHLLLYCLIF